jgi:hypothetical protein
MTRLLVVVALAGCDDLQGISGEATPLATLSFQITGDFESVRVPNATDEALRVALVWGAQWLPEPLCFLPAESAEAEAVIAAGCRDPLGFVPDRVDEDVPITDGAVSLYALPAADVMVGDVTGRIAYASFLVYDDRNGSGRLELGRAQRVPDPDDDDPPGVPEPLNRDIVYGASFVTMTEPDTRVALREGEYNERFAFYPRVGCGAPARGFSVVSAGGFSAAEAFAATLAGVLPRQDPATCSEQGSDAVTQIPLRAAAEVMETGCIGRRADSSVRYRQPPIDPIDLTNRVAACVKVPDFGEGTSITQYVVSSRSDERCKILTHYVLRGCDEDAACALPEWDITASPPAWWPCP